MSTIDIDQIISEIKEQALQHKSVHIEHYRRNLKFLTNEEQIKAVAQPSKVFKIGKKIDEKLINNTAYQKVRPNLVKYKEVVKNDQIIINVGELLKYEDVQFVSVLYERLLDREPDQEGLSSHVNMLRLNRLSKIDLIKGFLAGEEYNQISRNIKVRKLKQADILQRIQRNCSKLPVVGYLFNIIIEILMLPKRTRQLEEFRRVNAILINENKYDIMDVLSVLEGYTDTIQDMQMELEAKSQMVDNMGHRIRDLQTQLEAIDNKYAQEKDLLQMQLEAMDRKATEDKDLLQIQLKEISNKYLEEKAELQTQLESKLFNVWKELDETKKYNAAEMKDLQKELIAYIVQLQKANLATDLQLADTQKLILNYLKESSDIIQERNQGDCIDLNDFYIRFEDKFRGTEEEISKRLNIYIEKVKEHFMSKENIKILDLGCGRGEWIQKLKENNYKDIVGIDLNSKMIEECKAKGLEVINANAITYLKLQPDNSIDFISGFHIIEHLSFEEKLQFVEQSYRVLKKDGVLLLETPNPENVLVGSCSFYTDLTHRNPVHPETLKFLLEEVGLEQTEIIRVNPLNYIDQSQVDGEMRHIAYRFNMEQDYSVWGVK